MKQFIHLMKLEWKSDLYLCLGYPITLLIVAYYFLPSTSTYYREDIIFFRIQDQPFYFFILFMISFLTPWRNLFMTANVREKLQQQEWVFTLPIQSKVIFNRAWIKTVIVSSGILLLPFITKDFENNAQIRLYKRDQQLLELKLTEIQKYLPDATIITKIDEQQKSRQFIEIKNAQFYLKVLSALFFLWIYAAYLNLSLWVLQKASRFKYQKYFCFGLYGALILSPFLSILKIFKLEIFHSVDIFKFQFNPYQILAQGIQHIIPLLVLSFIALILTYLHGITIYKNREIE